MRAEFNATDIADPRNIAIVSCLDDDIVKFLGVVEPPIDVECVLEGLSGGSGWHSDLAGRDLLTLLLDRLNDILRHQREGLKLVGIKPDSHRILAGTEDGHIADAG